MEEQDKYDELATAAVNGMISILEFMGKVYQSEGEQALDGATLSIPIAEAPDGSQIQISYVKDKTRFIEPDSVRLTAGLTIIEDTNNGQG